MGGGGGWVREIICGLSVTTQGHAGRRGLLILLNHINQQALVMLSHD